MITLFLLLFLGTAHAETLREERLDCRSVQVIKDDSGKLYVNVHGESFIANGTSLRSLDRDIFPEITTQQQTQITTLFNGACNLMRRRLNIPTPAATITP